jgi:hypothetical protein
VDDFSILPNLPAAQPAIFAEKQLSRRAAMLHREGRERMAVLMEVEHAPEINRADDINVMQKERLCEAIEVFAKKISGLFQPATRVEQYLLARNPDVHTKVSVSREVIFDHLRKVVDVDDHVHDVEGSQPSQGDLKQRSTGNFHQSFRPVIGQWPQATPQASGQNHRSH